MKLTLEKIISGGQTGADRGALDFAISVGLPHGGWCPLGRRAEDGPIPKHYQLKETWSGDYSTRTSFNVRDSCGTLIFMFRPSPGSTLTVAKCNHFGRPFKKVLLSPRPDLEVGVGLANLSINDLAGWIIAHNIRVLNVAGHRESVMPGIEKFTCQILTEVFQYLIACSR